MWLHKKSHSQIAEEKISELEDLAKETIHNETYRERERNKKAGKPAQGHTDGKGQSQDFLGQTHSPHTPSCSNAPQCGLPSWMLSCSPLEKGRGRRQGSNSQRACGADRHLTQFILTLHHCLIFLLKTLPIFCYFFMPSAFFLAHKVHVSSKRVRGLQALQAGVVHPMSVHRAKRYADLEECIAKF